MLMKLLLYEPSNVNVIEPFASSRCKPFGLQLGFPLGLSYLASVLEMKSFEVKILDGLSENLDTMTLLKEVKKYNPDVVGMRILTATSKTAVAASRAIKEIE